MSGIGSFIERLAALPAFEAPSQLIARLGGGAPRRLAERGADVLGHPAHPPLTDLPIGFWTSAWALDLLPRRDRFAPAARTLIGLGLVSTVPAVVSGLGDAAGMDRSGRRTAALHAGLNTAATAAFAASWWLRGRNSGAGRLTAHLGAALATAGAAVGGHLALGSVDEDDHEPDRPDIGNLPG